MNREPSEHASSTKKTSNKLILSYALDWITIAAFFATGGALSYVKPHHRPFSLRDPDISYPLVEEQITTWMLVLIALLTPAVFVAVISLVFVPGSSARRSMPRGEVQRIRMWELERGLAGLGLSVAVAFCATQGMKNAFGRPRPSLLARCVPDWARAPGGVVGGEGRGVGALVDVGICLQGDGRALDEGFRSFPSGHASWSWSGLLYLTLYLCAKFAVGLPEIPLAWRVSGQQQQQGRQGCPTSEQEVLPLHTRPHPRPHADRPRSSSEQDRRANDEQRPVDTLLSIRNSAASPPNFWIVPALAPVAVAVYICSTRYAEFYHFGWDLLAGSCIGIATSYLSFRWYHLPLGAKGGGWAWGSRSEGRAFVVGVGMGGWRED